MRFETGLAHLAASTTASNCLAFGRSATAVWELNPHPRRPVIAVARQRRLEHVEVVTCCGLGELDRVSRHGIPTVRLETAIASMAPAHHSSIRSIHELADEAIRRGLTTNDRLLDAMEQMARLVRRGRRSLNAVITDRAMEQSVPLSAWSRDIADRLERSGVERPTMEHRITDTAGSMIAQVDLAYPNHRYAIELDSVTYHLDRASFERDRRRDVVLATAGWHVDRFTWSQTESEWFWVLSASATARGPIVLIRP